MKRLIIGVFAALSIALGMATPAGATPYTAADMDFVAAATFYGYPDDKDRLIGFGHKVCENLDAGVSMQNVTNWVGYELTNTHDGNTPEDYWASLFIQSAAIAYCPWQPAAEWTI